MGKPRFLVLLLVVALLALSFSQGYGRKVHVMKAVRHYARWRSPLHGHQEDSGMVSTEMDYSDPKANTNPRGGAYPSPDPTSPPSH